MDIVRQDRSERVQEYYFHVGENEGWEFTYTEFKYPDKFDKPVGAVIASLSITEKYPNKPRSIRQINERDVGYFNDIFYLGANEQVSNYSESVGIGHSPAINRLKESDKQTLDRIRDSLSAEARKLFDSGLERYVEPI